MTTMTPIAVPASMHVRTMLEDLLGREVTVGTGKPFVTEDLPGLAVAVYTDPNLQMVAVLGLDLPLAAHAGAALGLLPVGAAEDAIEEQELSAALAENVGELCNIFTSLLNREGAPHLKLYQFLQPGQDAPADVSAQLLALGQRLDLTVDVARYGRGRLALSLVNL